MYRLIRRHNLRSLSEHRIQRNQKTEQEELLTVNLSKMKNNEYPNWLVPLYIAKELKEIGFNEPTLFHYYENDFDVTIETNDYYNEGEAQGYLSFYISALKEEDFNIYKKCISLPTWEQVFEWFREKGMFHSICIVDDLLEGVKYFEAEIRDNNGDIIYILSRVTYEEAREALAKALIRTYKQEQLK